MKLIRIFCIIFSLFSKGESNFNIGQSHIAFSEKVETVYVNKKHLGFKINHLDTLLALKLPSKNFISKLSSSFSGSSKLEIHINDILKDAKHLAKLSSSFSENKSDQICYLANIELVISELIENIITKENREKRDVTDPLYIELFNDYNTQLNTLLNVDLPKTRFESDFLSLNQIIQTYKTSKSDFARKETLTDIRRKLACLVTNKQINHMRILFFVVMQGTPILTLQNLQNIETYGINDLRRILLQSLVSTNTSNLNSDEFNNVLKDIECEKEVQDNNIQDNTETTKSPPPLTDRSKLTDSTPSPHPGKSDDSNFNNNDELSQSNIEGNGVNLDMSGDISELLIVQKSMQNTIETNQKHNRLTETLQNKGILCSTPFLKNSCSIIKKKLKNSLRTHFNLDENTIESVVENFNEQTTINDIAEKISKFRNNNLSNKYSVKFIFNEKATSLDFEVINEFLYRSTNMKEDFIVSQLLPLENSLKFLIMEFVNLNNAKNAIIDKDFYKNCVGLPENKDVAILKKQMYTFEEKVENQNIFKILPFCGAQTCFKLQQKDIVSLNNRKFCSIEIINNKIAFCDSIVDEVNNCVFEKQQTDLCKFKKINVKSAYELYDNIIYHCSKELEECAYFKFSKRISDQYISLQEFVDNFEKLNFNNSSFFKDNEDVLIQAAISFALVVITGLIVKFCKSSFKIITYCFTYLFKCRCCKKKRNNIDLRNRTRNLTTVPDIELNPLAS